ncbi:uncharacterized protein [Henckelia pumila]|uniref:uncharacterized protein n=1 Tax=Henckelia pumila TaxID=405737 RepID=UPI003C6E8DD1
MEGPKNSNSKEDMRAENSSMADKKDALAQMPNYAKFLKDLLKNKKKLKDLAQETMNEECLAVLQNRLPPKFQDPGSFSIPCQIGNLSLKNILGIVENVLVKIDHFIYPVDFVILDMDEDYEVPLILGRPFLAASRALIDVKKGELVYRVNDEQVVFNMFKSSSDSTNLKYCFSVNFIDVIHDVGKCQQV